MNSLDPVFVRPLLDANRPSAEALAALQSHPRFPEAMRDIAAGIVALYNGNRLFNAVVIDRGRYLMSVFALHLHFSGRPGDARSGLTVSRMRALCAEHKICSPGRAEAMLLLMRFFGHLAPAPSETDRRLRRLVPSEDLIAWHRARCKFIFEATAKLLPDGAEALAALASPEFIPRFIKHLAHSYFAGFYYVEHIPEIRIFYERSAGVAILMQLLLAGEPDDAFPPTRPVSLSLGARAQLRGVTRTRAPAIERLRERGLPGAYRRGRGLARAAALGGRGAPPACDPHHSQRALRAHGTRRDRQTQRRCVTSAFTPTSQTPD